jgi:hypothetical protein
VWSLKYDHWTGRASLLVMADEDDVKLTNVYRITDIDVYHVDELRAWAAREREARRQEQTPR